MIHTNNKSEIHFKKILIQKKFLTLTLILLIFLTLFFESFGFAMLLPVIEGAIGSGTDTKLGLYIKEFLQFFEVNYSIENILIIFVVAIVLKNILIIARDSLRTYYAYSFKRDAMIGINKSLMEMNYSDFQKEKHGHLISDTLSATQHATLFVIQFIEFITSIFTVIVFVVVMYLTDPTMTIFFIVFGFIFFLIFKLTLHNYGKSVGMKEVEMNQQATDYLTESVSLMRDFRLNLLEKFQLNRLREKLDNIVHLEVKWNALTASIQPLVEILIILLFASFVFYIVSEDSVETLRDRIPAIALMLVLAQRTFVRASQISRTYISIVRYFVPFSVVSRYLLNDINHGTGTTYIDFNRKIFFKKISISSDSKIVIKNSSFSINPGKVTGIVGKSGTGKSSLVDILMRLREPNSGSVFIGQKNINDIDIKLLRRKISVVNQSLNLRNVSVMENIKTGNFNATDNEVYKITKDLGIHEFITTLPEGYNTIVGDKGDLISGGQAQRILTARALVREPEILILDEFTSALDKDTEEKINQHLIEFMRNKTIIIITHRESTLKYCEEVFSIGNKSIKKIK